MRFLLYFLLLSVTVAVNYLANALPLNGQRTGEISRKLEVLFTPAGYVFGIWGVIYSLLFLWVFRQLLIRYRFSPVYRAALAGFAASCIFNTSWIVLWHYEQFIMTVVVMVLLLLSLIYVYVRVREVQQTFFDLLPFSIYLGWVSVALIANISYVLVYYQWDGWGLSAVVWTVLLLLTALTLALLMQWRMRDDVYPLVFIWAFVGIFVQRYVDYPVVGYTALACAFILVVSFILSRWAAHRRAAETQHFSNDQ